MHGLSEFHRVLELGCEDCKISATVSLNFGTTYSAGAIVTELKCADHYAIHAHQRPKFPNRLVYSVNEEETKTMEFLGPGDRLLPTHTILEYPKMALFSNLSMQPFLNRMGIDSRVGRALNQLRTGFEYSLKHLLNRITAQVVMTLPAALDPDGQAVFTEAVGQAIALPLTYMAEHEAALRAVLLQESSVIATLQERGKSVMVVDVGGLTVDEALHCFENGRPGRAPSPRSEIGGVVCLDATFEAMCSIKLRAIDCNPDLLPIAIEQIMRVWHNNIKPSFHPDMPKHNTLRVRISHVGVLEMSAPELQSLFDRFTEFIGHHVSLLWDEALEGSVPPKNVFVTGGISQNDYFLCQLERVLQAQYSGTGDQCPIIVYHNKDDKSITNPRWNAVAIGGGIRYVHDTDLAQRRAQVQGSDA